MVAHCLPFLSQVSSTGTSFYLPALLLDCTAVRCRALCLSRRQARRNLSDHARLLAALPSEESEANENAEQDCQHQHQYQYQEYGHSSQGSVGRDAGGVGAWGGQEGGGDGDEGAEEDGMAVDDGEVRAWFLPWEEMGWEGEVLGKV